MNKAIEIGDMVQVREVAGSYQSEKHIGKVGIVVMAVDGAWGEMVTIKTKTGNIITVSGSTLIHKTTEQA